MALTEQKRRYADARLSGLTKKEAAIEAGCPAKTASQAASRYEKDPDVQAAMGRTIAVQAMMVDEPPADPDAYIPAPADDPVEFFRNVTNDLKADPRLRLDAAKSWAQYTLAKPGETGKKEDKANAAKEASKGRFGTAPPPLRAVK